MAVRIIGGDGASSPRVLRGLSLVCELAVLELKCGYRRSLLGPAWVIVQPLTYLLIFGLVAPVLNISSGGAPYMVFAASGLLPWLFFSNTTMRCASTVLKHAAWVRSTALPRELFVAAELLRSSIELLGPSIGLLLVMAWFGVPASWALLWLPVLLLLTVLAVGVVGLAAAASGAYWADVAFVFPFALQLWLLATPVMYSLDAVPEHWRLLYCLNPMVGVVDGFRSVLVAHTAPALMPLSVALVVCAAAGALVWPLFHYASKYFSDAL